MAEHGSTVRLVARDAAFDAAVADRAAAVVARLQALMPGLEVRHRCCRRVQPNRRGRRRR